VLSCFLTKRTGAENVEVLDIIIPCCIILMHCVSNSFFLQLRIPVGSHYYWLSVCFQVDSVVTVS
jgi:hypothetical protein